MAILIEGMTLVFENNTLEAKYLEGLYGLGQIWTTDHFVQMVPYLAFHFLRKMMASVCFGQCVIWA